MTKRILLLAMLCCLSFTGLTAQIRYCMSYADYQEGIWTELDTLKLKGRGQSHKIKTENDSLNKVLKEEAFAVLYHDTLLVNIAHMYYNGERFGKGYAPAYFFRDGRICFINRLPHEKDGSLAPAAFSFGVMFGAIGAGLVAGAYAASNEGYYCFLVKREYEGGRKEARMRDDKYMQRYEKNSPKFYADYMSIRKQKKREAASHVLPLLKHWKLIL
ncbi:MAG: hypothetical protein IJT48_00915 [Bacteroidaceae bacterium]|nr:hypothetical protein [Bacteroidaceae bacterium]